MISVHVIDAFRDYDNIQQRFSRKQCEWLLFFLVLILAILKKKKRHTAQKVKFSIKDFFSKYDQIRRKLRIWSLLPKKS